MKDLSPRSVPFDRALPDHLGRICDRFAQAWKSTDSGQSPPCLEDYLQGITGSEYSLLLRELVLQDANYRQNREKGIPLQEYLQRFPEHADWLHEQFRDVETVLSDHSRGLSPSDDSSRPPALAGTAGQVPDQLGRYRITGILGSGGFGTVYRGHDEELRRDVAIKVPRPERVSQPEDVEAFLEEARILASLDHPHIVPVHDVGRTEDGLCFVVSRFIEGTDLRARLQQGSLPLIQAVELVAWMSEALHHAHGRGLVHRDVKPGNILLDTTGKAFLADFGLALKEEDLGQGRGLAGTPAYMSPEQARGEGHRVDGRSDIFSLGVVFYELLTGRRPFRATENWELLEQIATLEPRPPRQILDTLPRELERICLKALAKRASERYTTARDLADDLRHWPGTLQTREGVAVPQVPVAVPVTPSSPPSQEGPPPVPTPVRVVPKGLRSFDAADADFFLELLPGARDRDGLPESIRFWKQRVEEADADQAFAVGLLYGPSGCGKSSLVKAGLLPRLAKQVLSVYVEASPEQTETRVLAGLRKYCEGLSTAAGLKEALTALRRGQGVPPGHKVLIVLDQFEQWLHARRLQENTELVQALRQADGGRVQVLLLVRDDFWLAVSRLMTDLEIDIRQGENTALVDLFDPLHARKVLTAFGQAFGRLPENTGELTREQETFLEQAVSGLAREGKVISVRLALFAEMVKGKPWIPTTLREVGGTEGVGITFLEETFSSSTANPLHRQHQRAARAVLRSLLPDQGTDIKGNMRSDEELLSASGYANRARDFATLVRILDTELRLITPTDPEGVQDEEGEPAQPAAAGAGRYYQLTHDYLVPSLRAWLTRKQQETRRGRAELRLAERCALWERKPENRYLPAWYEWLTIRWLTRRRDWTAAQKRMMHTAARYHSLRGLALGVFLAVAVIVGLFVRHQVRQQNRATEAAGLVEALRNAETAQVPEIVARMQGYRALVEEPLRQELAQAPTGSKQKLHTALALLPVDGAQVPYLQRRLLDADPHELQVLRDALQPYQDQLTEALWQVAVQPPQPQQRLRAASALAVYDPDDKRWQRIAASVVEDLVRVPSVYLAEWMKYLQPVRAHLQPPLATLFADSERSEVHRAVATDILAVYAADQPRQLVSLLVQAEPEQFRTLFPLLEPHRTQALPFLRAELARELHPQWKDGPRAASWSEPPTLLHQQIEAGQGLLEERFALCQTMALKAFVQVTDQLQMCGYRLFRLRPYAVGNEVQVAALWTRDDRRWQWAHGQTAEQIREQDTQLRKQGYIPVDVAGYLAGAGVDRKALYCAVWVQPAEKGEMARMYVGMASAVHKAARDGLKKQKLIPSTLHALRDPEGQVLYSGVWWKSSRTPEGGRVSWNNTTPAHEDQLADLSRMAWDVGVVGADLPPTPREHATAELAAAEQALGTNPRDPNALYRRARAYFALGEDGKARADFDALVKRYPKFAGGYRYRAVLHARRGEEERARADLHQYTTLTKDRTRLPYLKAMVAAYLGEDRDALLRLDQALEKHSEDATLLYNAACACAVAARAVSHRQQRQQWRAVGAGWAVPAQGGAGPLAVVALTCNALPNPREAQTRMQAHRQCALSLLHQAVEQGYMDFEGMYRDADLVELHSQPAFEKLLGRAQLDRRYALVQRLSPTHEGQEVHGLNPTEHLGRGRQLANAGWRPLALSVAQTRPDQPLVTVSAWYRPVVATSRKETLARQQANAAVALVRSGVLEPVWPLLRHSADPTRRSYLIHRLGPLSAEVQPLLQRLSTEGEVSTQRALILSLGQYTAEQLPVSLRQPLVKELLRRYRSDPDPGIHSAIAWLLRHGKDGPHPRVLDWGQSEALAQIDKQLQGQPPRAGQRWYVNHQGQTFAIFAGPIDFLMGSPASESGRDTDETLHRRRVDRSFALATTEVTVQQFQQFLKANPQVRHRYTKKYSPVPEGPIISVTWYEAIQYCRWLSEQDPTIPEDQYCYPSVAKIEKAKQPGATLTLPRDYLSRRGYRLPTEAEWECACRAGARTSRHYGSSNGLLPPHAWYQTNSQERTWPVGHKKPNGYGLFDMHGNVWEWCQDRSAFYQPQRGAIPDKEDNRDISDRFSRFFRGGSFGYQALHLRCADRYHFRPSDRGLNGGLRLARTWR